MPNPNSRPRVSGLVGLEGEAGAGPGQVTAGCRVAEFAVLFAQLKNGACGQLEAVADIVIDLGIDHRREALITER